MNRRDLVVAGAGVAAGAVGLGWFLLRPPADDDPGADFWRLRFELAGGGELELASLRGSPLLLNFWATWCPPCVKEFPQLDRFQREFGPRGWKVVALAADSATMVRGFLERVPVSFTVAIAGFDGIELGRRLGNRSGALPFSLLIDAAGRIRYRKLGEATFGEFAGWADRL